MIAVLWWSGSRTERLYEERDADAFGPTNFLQRGGRPRLALHHLGKQVPFEDRHQLGERLEYFRPRDLLMKMVRTDVAEHAHGGGVGIQDRRKMAILDEPLQQVLQRPGAGRFVATPLIDVPDDVLEHLAGTSERHFRIYIGDKN